MKTVVKIFQESGTNVLLFNAMVAHDDKLTVFGDIQPNGDDTEVTVEVLVNGVAVPFKEALERAVDRLLADLNDRVMEKAVELIKESALADLMHELDAADFKIRTALEAVLPR